MTEVITYPLSLKVSLLRDKLFQRLFYTTIAIELFLSKNFFWKYYSYGARSGLYKGWGCSQNCSSCRAPLHSECLNYSRRKLIFSFSTFFMLRATDKNSTGVLKVLAFDASFLRSISKTKGPLLSKVQNSSSYI